MPPEPTTPPPANNSPAENAPPLLASPPPLAGPPILPPKPNPNASAGRNFLAFLLSVCFVLFLADAVISLADDSLALFLGTHALAGFRAIILFFTIVMAFAVYGLMAITPLIPKRFFIPLTLFNPVALLLTLPLGIYFFARMPLLAWLISICQVVFALVLLYQLQGRLTFRWPLVPATRLTGRGFSCRNLFGFVAVNLFLAMPAVIIYLIFCSSLAVDHLTDGFVTLRRDGFAMQMRKYVRADGKTVQLFPMSHVADAAFYRKVTASFPSNSVILMEGVTDEQNLLTNKISYARVAKKLGVAEQHEEFQPMQGEWVHADVDVAQFSSNTIVLLNMVMRFHSQGLTPESILAMTQYTPPPGFEEELWNDLLVKRNEHVLHEMNSRLANSDYIVIPWGAMHMAGISKEIQKSGFRLNESQEFLAIRFRFFGKKQFEATGANSK